jgi:hypothetical protein
MCPPTDAVRLTSTDSGASTTVSWEKARTSAESHCCFAEASRSTFQLSQPVMPPRSGVPYGDLPDEGRTMNGTPSTRSTLAICACEPTIATPLPLSLRKSDSSFWTSLTSMRSVSWLESVSAGSFVGWWAKTMTLLTVLSSTAVSSACCSIGSWSQSEPRRVPSALFRSTNRVPLWSNVRYG